MGPARLLREDRERLVKAMFDGTQARPWDFVKSFPTESLILAQNERWRRGLGMQVERGWGQLQPSGERVSSAWETYPLDGDNTSNEVLIPDKTTELHGSAVKDGLCLQAITRGWSRVPLACW